MAPSKPDLMKIGFEGFAMLDEYFAQKNKRQHRPPPPPPPTLYHHQNYYVNYQPPKPHVYQMVVPVATTMKKEELAYAVDCYEAAKYFGGTVIAEYPKTKTNFYN